MKPLIACAIMLCITLPLHAETYKWVDDKGVTNYSSEPPPAKKGSSSVKVVEDRISVVPKDPTLDKAAEGLRNREARRAQYAEAEYARRQSLPPSHPTTYDIYSECPYGADCSGYGFYPGYGYYSVSNPAWRRAAFINGVRPRPTHPIANNGHGVPARTIPSPLRVSMPLR